jgi:hypothetical protein
VARIEDVGPLLVGRLRTLVGDRCKISLKPVIDLPAGHIPVDSYEIPARLREQLQLRYPADVFPYAAAVCRRMDQDHTIPYLSPDKGGPPGQTRIGNLGPCIRRHHNYKTKRWLAGSPTRTRHVAVAITPPPDLPGQRQRHPPPLGDSEFAQKMWRAAVADVLSDHDRNYGSPHAVIDLDQLRPS